MTSPWERLLGGLVLGEEEFARNLLKRGTSRKPNEKEQTSARQLARRRKGWAEVVKAAEQELGRTWQEIAETWGDWGRDGTIYVAVRHGRVRLSEVVKAAGGLSYGSGAQAVRRFEQGLGKDRKKQRFVQALRRRIH